MSLLRAGMLVNGRVYSTGSRQAGSKNAPKMGALTSLRLLIITSAWH
jgi:hypothetical protein